MIVKLLKYISDRHPTYTFLELVEVCIQQLVGYQYAVVKRFGSHFFTVIAGRSIRLGVQKPTISRRAGCVTVRMPPRLACCDLAGTFASRDWLNVSFCGSRGSPLLVGIKSQTQLTTNHFPVHYSKGMSAHSLHQHIASWNIEFGYVSLPDPFGCILLINLISLA